MPNHHDALLARAIEAHERYLAGMEQLKAERQRAFMEALRSTVTASEIARITGISNRHVGRIARGES